MDLKEILKKQGMTEEQISAVLKAMTDASLHVVEGDDPEKTLKELQEENGRLKGVEQQNQTLKFRAAVSQGLAKAGAKDPDYLMYQFDRQELAGKLMQDEKGRVTGIEEVVKVLQDDFKGYFTDLGAASVAETKSTGTKAGDGAEALKLAGVQLLEKKLETGELDVEPETLAEAITQHYAQQEDKD